MAIMGTYATYSSNQIVALNIDDFVNQYCFRPTRRLSSTPALYSVCLVFKSLTGKGLC
jgi:hypothetical protein